MEAEKMLIATELTESENCSLETMQKFQTWRRRVKPLFSLLNKAPTNDLEKKICSDENQISHYDPLMKDPCLIRKCEKLFNELTEQINQLKGQFMQVWNNVQSLFEELKENEENQLAFTYGEIENLKALKNLESKFLLRKVEKRKRIATFIGELRNEISEIWDKCMITEIEKSRFQAYYIDEFTEEILELHKKELKKWQTYHVKNQEILVKIKQREEMWKNLRELEAKAEDPNRFINRGGTLLKDQTSLNNINKSLPKLETEIIKLANKFEKEQGQKMTIRGKEIPMMIDEERQAYQTEKTAKKNSRLTQLNNNSSNNRTAQVKSRQSIMPMQTSSVRPAEKRPATRLNIGTPTHKLPRMCADEEDDK